ncbi:glycosyltransferase family 4 protein [Streptomyces mirabilis]|uniref:glycosyltransferase family 4 protein n=1 Tax=Streptomyces mirabilis TaxID=68239 RepID=UPI0036834DD3
MARISFILPSYPRSPVGGYKIVFLYANHLARRGHEVFVLNMRARELSAIPIHKQLALRAAYRAGRRRRPRWFVFEPTVQVLNHVEMRRELIPPSDLVIATSVATADIVQSLAGPGCGALYFIQHFEDFTHSPEEVIRTWSLPMHRVVVSAWLADIAGRHGLATTLVENGVDRSCFSPGPRQADRPPRVLAMVSDQRFKRTDVVEAVYQRLAAALPSARLVTFGTCERPPSLPSSATHVVDPRVDALARLYQQSQVFLCASDFEGFGLPALEAMSCGAAVVSTDNGGVPAFAGSAARYARPGNVDELLTMTVGLLRDEADRAALASLGLARAAELSLESTTRGFESVVEEELGSLVS